MLAADGPPATTGGASDLMRLPALAAIYDALWRPALGRLAKGLLGPGMDGELRCARALLDLREGDGVLDVGCGPGHFTRAFARDVGAGGLAVGLDASAEMLAQATAARAGRHRALAWVRGDAQALPFVDASFDAACCFAALYFLPDPWRALDELVRVVRPGGRVAILTSVAPRFAPANAAAKAFGRRSGTTVFDDLAPALRDRGLVEVHGRAWGLAQVVGGVRPG